VGAHGAISGIHNVLPQLSVEAQEAAERGDWEAARRGQELLFRAGAILRVVKGAPQSGVLGGIKAALEWMGVIASARVLAPLRSPTPEDKAEVVRILGRLGVPLPAYAGA